MQGFLDSSLRCATFRMTGDEGAAFGMLRGEGTSFRMTGDEGASFRMTEDEGASFRMTEDEGASFRMKGDEGVSFRMTELTYFSSLKRFVCQMSAEPSFSVCKWVSHPHPDLPTSRGKGLKG